ncbi:gp16 family protein [Pseudomonas sp.]|uniref:gp16 family protein n=1 Tax=Pseudomonas sp. TaxID=306 RepID=UPI003D0FF2FD
MATPKQIKLIHVVKGALGLDDGTYRDILAGYGVESSKDLDAVEAAKLLRDLEDKATAAGVWKRGGAPKRSGKKPHNLKAGRHSRQAQLQKIEALLTVGGKSWAYADALALRICKVEKLAWVPEDQLYKVITALRKQAQREGWDLSGEE